jgi:hypothetical protein
MSFGLCTDTEKKKKKKERKKKEVLGKVTTLVPLPTWSKFTL